MTSDPELRPPPPIAKRLNRNALTVAAVIMGMTVLTAVVVLHPGEDAGEEVPGATTGSLIPQSRPTFLDQPAPAGDALADSAVGGLPGLVPDRPGGRLGITEPVAAQFAGGGGMPEEDGSARRQAFEAALRSPVLAGGPGARNRGEPRERQAAGDSLTTAALGDTASRSSARSRHQDFLRRAGNVGGTSVAAQLEPAGSPYTLRAGTVMPGVLLTGINSDLPGEIVAQVSRNVYDSRTQRLHLVPKGAKLIGTYDNQVAAGQDRLLVAWTRLILPDGRSMTLPGLALKDRTGQTGAADKVDHHFGRVFGRAVLLSAISAGAQLSQPRQGSILAAPSPGQVAAGALGQELSSVAVEILRRGMDVAPTITIRQGQPFLVFLNGDLVFDGPYEPAP